MSGRSEKVHGCPGTGKTWTLQERVSSLCADGYKLSDITLTTFRKQTAMELKERDGLEGTQAGTLHHICRVLLGGPDVMDIKDDVRFGEAYGYKMNTRAAAEDPTSGTPKDCYSWVRNTFTPLEDVYMYPGYDAISHIDMERFITDYETYKQEVCKVDFTDLLTMVHGGQTTLNTSIMLGDEYQDFTPLQDAVFRKLSKGMDYTIIAGDPAQSIYGMFGGKPELFNDWNVETNTILQKSHRLYTPIWDLARTTLQCENQDAPDIVTKEATHNPIRTMRFDDPYPDVGGSVLHLIRCNYQKDAIAMQLAELGTLFSGLDGWTTDELKLFNVILKMREKRILKRDDMWTLRKYYSKHVLISESEIENNFLATDIPPVTKALYEIMRTPNPVAYCDTPHKLLMMKIGQVLKARNTPIEIPELKNVRLLTIHGAKGAEADTVFLHTGITPRIRKSICFPSGDSQAEARVWYVGITRAKKWLYLVRDKGKNYELPVVVS